jgi:hypothetical protein
MGKWKMVKTGNHSWLYDLTKDIGESKNLANEKPDVLEILQEAFDHWRNGMPPPAWPSRPEHLEIEVDGVIYKVNI